MLGRWQVQCQDNTWRKRATGRCFNCARCVCAGVLIGSGMGGLTIFQDGVKNLVEKGYKKITPFFIPYAITNMCAPWAYARFDLYLGERARHMGLSTPFSICASHIAVSVPRSPGTRFACMHIPVDVASMQCTGVTTAALY